MILIQINESYTMREMADALKISKSSPENHVCQLGYVNWFDVCVPRMLSKKKLFFTVFQSLQNSLTGKNFNSLEDFKMYLEQFLDQKDKTFLEDGIMKLPEKW